MKKLSHMGQKLIKSKTSFCPFDHTKRKFRELCQRFGYVSLGEERYVAVQCNYQPIKPAYQLSMTWFRVENLTS